MSKFNINNRTTWLLAAFMLLTSGLWAQVPGGINYQAMALDTGGNPIQNQTIRLRMSILEQSASGNPAFQEWHLTSTDANGIFALQIGMGTALISQIDSVDWGNSPVYLKVEMDKTGGTNYSLIGVTQFFTVPYAFRAAYAPDEDADPVNELQDLSLNNGALSISNGNSIDLATSLFQFDVNRTLFADSRDNTGFSIPLDSSTAATNNTLFGAGTGAAGMTGYQNSLYGHRSGQSLTSGYNNIYVGVHTGRLTTSGYGNVALGVGAGEKNQTGQYNTYIGDQAGKNALGAYNTVIGKSAGYSLTTGSNNVFLGTNAGVYNQTGSNNVFLGMNAGFNELGSNRLYIDNSNTASPLIHGKFDTDELTINGDLDITGNITQNGGPLTVNPLDNDSTNELQTLSLVGDTLSISEGNAVVLPEMTDADSTNELQTLGLSGKVLSLSSANSVSLPDEVDGDSTNELQTLSLVGDTLSISEGNSVLLLNDTQLSVDIGLFSFSPSTVNQTLIIYHDLGVKPSLLEVEWSTDDTAGSEGLSGNGYYRFNEVSSISRWRSSTVSTSHWKSEVYADVFIRTRTNFAGVNWDALIDEVTDTYVKIRVNYYNQYLSIQGIWKMMK